MKNLKTIAIAAVAIFGIGGAVVANQLADPLPNVMNNAAEGQPEQWVPLTDSRGCDHDTERKCIGYRATPSSSVITYEFGNKL